MSKLDELIDRMKTAAVEMQTMNEFGALHIFVSDGNCESENLEFCLWQQNITPEEYEFCNRMLHDFTEEQRCGIYAFSQVIE